MSDGFFSDAERLPELAHQLLDLSLRGGATQAQVSVFQRQGLSLHLLRGRTVSRVRETYRGFSLTVFQGQKSGTVRCTRIAPDSLAHAVQAANLIACHTGEDSAAGIACPGEYCTVPRALDLFHPWQIDETGLKQLALRIEDGIAQVAPQVQSDGARVASSQSCTHLANSAGFSQSTLQSAHSASAIALARDANAQAQRDYARDLARLADKLVAPESLGLEAGRAAFAYLASGPLKSKRSAVLFSPRCAASLIGHIVDALSGRALYLGASFLQEKLGSSVLAAHLSLREDPFVPGAPGSFAFDIDGIEPSARDLVRAGVLEGYLLSLYAARRLQQAPTGSGSGHGNLTLLSSLTEPQDDLARMLRKLGKGLFVTDLSGDGVRIHNGIYSRSARGFWVEDGKIQHAVTGIALAGNLTQMLQGIVAIGSDVARFGTKSSGSLLIDDLQLSGQ
jgi:PmbA protein